MRWSLLEEASWVPELATGLPDKELLRSYWNTPRLHLEQLAEMEDFFRLALPSVFGKLKRAMEWILPTHSIMTLRIQTKSGELGREIQTHAKTKTEAVYSRI
jgi:hypothetical protein